MPDRPSAPPPPPPPPRPLPDPGLVQEGVRNENPPGGKREHRESS